MKLRVAVLIAVLGLVQSDWDTEPAWAFETYLDSDFVFRCNDTNAMVQDGDVVQWKSPQGEMIMDSEKYSLNNEGNVGGMILKIRNVQHEDKGIYLCLVYRNNVFVRKLNRGLNLYRPAYKMAIDEYRYNIVVGVIAAAVFFVPMVGMCIIYQCRYQTDEQREKYKVAKRIRKNVSRGDLEAGPLPSKTAPQNGAGLVNPGFQESTNL